MEPTVQDWGLLPWLAPFLLRAFFLRRRFEDMRFSLHRGAFDEIPPFHTGAREAISAVGTGAPRGASAA